MFDLFRKRAETHVQFVEKQKFQKEFTLPDREEDISPNQTYRLNECRVYLCKFASSDFLDEFYGT